MATSTSKNKKTEKKEAQKCPNCEEGYLTNRAKRSLAVKIFLFWLPVKRYKCNKCHKKTYVYGTPKAQGSNIVGE